MQKFVISVLGYDRPGIIATVSRVLFELECNVEDVSQTTLQTEFAGIFIISAPDPLPEEKLFSELQKALTPMGLSILVKPMRKNGEQGPVSSEPFVVTTIGPDRLGLVAGITEVMARFGVNITNLKAAFRGGKDPRHNVMIYEVDIPVQTSQGAFRKALTDRAVELGLDISLQHREIFEAIHRI